MESISDCLIFIDTMILSGIEKYACIRNLEGLRDCIIRMYKKIYIGEIAPVLVILSQFNLKMEKFCFDNENDIKKQYHNLSKKKY